MPCYLNVLFECFVANDDGGNEEIAMILERIPIFLAMKMSGMFSHHVGLWSTQNFSVSHTLPCGLLEPPLEVESLRMTSAAWILDL